MSDKQSKESVKSPANSLGETISNSAGSLPPTWSVEKTFEEAIPPNKPASNSTTGMGSKKGD